MAIIICDLVLDAMDWGAKRVAALKQFKEAQTILELGAGDFSRTLALAKKFPEKQFVTSDYEFSEKALQAMTETASLPNVVVTRADAHNLDFKDGLFDFIFSIALMEHIPRPADALGEFFRVLKPGGSHWFIQAPFWSCAKGHHFRHWDQKVLDAIPTFSHLYLSEDEMREALHERNVHFGIDECLQRIYHRSDLSRLTRNQTRDIVEASPFQLMSWEETPCSEYSEDLAKAILPKLRFPVTLDEMSVSGATVLQTKPMGSASGRSRIYNIYRQLITRLT